MRPDIYEPQGVQFMGILTLTIFESRSYGRHIWIFRLRQIRRRYVWHSSKSHDLQRLRVIEEKMDTLMVWPISHLLPNSRQPIPPSLMPIRKLQGKSVWCDVCKLAYPQGHVRQQTPAVWQVISETQKHKGRTRNYCQPCANNAQMWHDGSIWTFRQQLDYALGKEAIDGMELTGL